jgi:hypothetical protein
LNLHQLFSHILTVVFLCQGHYVTELHRNHSTPLCNNNLKYTGTFLMVGSVPVRYTTSCRSVNKTLCFGVPVPNNSKCSEKRKNVCSKHISLVPLALGNLRWLQISQDIITFLASSVLDPDPHWIRIQWPPGSGSRRFKKS